MFIEGRVEMYIIILQLLGITAFLNDRSVEGTILVAAAFGALAIIKGKP